MTRLNPDFNDPARWEEMKENAQRRVEVDLQEMEQVIELAQRTPGLAEYHDGLQHLSIFFRVATREYRQNDPGRLVGLVAFWKRYRDAVIQRYAAVTPVELRAADKVVRSIFSRVLAGVPNDRIAYSPDAAPLVYGGQGGLGAYFTHPPGWNRPFAIINLPHTAFDNVWQWLALPHETGHDTYATVAGLADELESALAERMVQAVADGDVTIPDVSLDLQQYGVPHKIAYTGKEFLSTLWRAWANEAQADIIGLLSCGGGAALSLQQIIGFGADDTWELHKTQAGIGDAPEVHPTSYVRNALNIAALRLIGDHGHSSLADEIEARFKSLKPQATHVVWRLAETVKVAQVPVEEMIRSAGIAAEVLVNKPLNSLGNQSYRDIGDFTAADQAVVDEMTQLLVEGDPTFAQVNDRSARHALAASMFAFESSPQNAMRINETFKHFV